MILEIKEYPDPVLSRKCEKVEEMDQENLVEDMLETMYANEGIGLAAPQVGILKRILVLDVGNGSRAFINPEIINNRGKVVSEEGCLSIPGVFVKVKRFEEVTVKAQNVNGENFTIKATGILARCLQHEIDHLSGILILDRENFWQKAKKEAFKIFRR